MTRLFADSAFYIALIYQPDRLRAEATRLASATREDEKVTTEGVLTEVLNHFCGLGPHLRAMALEFARTLGADPRTTIIRQTPELFDAGLKLYGERPDKGYSHTDCMSMVVCQQQGIERVLTHDRHFAQEGLEILL